MKTKLKNMLWFFGLICFLGMIASFNITAYAQEDPVSEAKKSVIEIYAGINDTTGAFQKIKHGSGVVISSQDNMAYILTSYKFLHISEDKIKEFCNKNGIALDGYGSTPEVVIKAVVKGDVLVDADMITESADKNFTVLQIDNSMCEKVPLALGDSSELVIGSKVYTLGFAEDAGDADESMNRNTQFTYEDVVISEGNITDTMSNQNGIYYLQHTANVDQGNKGGPLVDEEGYIVGINDSSVSNADNSYSMAINDIAEILDNFKLVYESKAKQLSLDSLAEKISECKKLIASGEYKSKSTETLQTAIEEAESLQEAGDENIEAVQTVMNDLDAGKAALVPKMKTSRKITIVLGIVDAFVLLFMLKLILDKRKLTRDKNKPKKTNTNKNKKKKKEKIKTTELRSEELKMPTPAESKIVVTNQKDNEYMSDATLDGEAFEDGDATVILSAEDLGDKLRPRAKITFCRNGEQVFITKASFNLGKNPDRVDYVIKDNPAVSRFHATIAWEGNYYYVSDRGSANGTYVNGDSVGKNQKHQLENGDHIIFANEECIFELI